jgi:hypothetical protein
MKGRPAITGQKKEGKSIGEKESEEVESYLEKEKERESDGLPGDKGAQDREVDSRKENKPLGDKGAKQNGEKGDEEPLGDKRAPETKVDRMEETSPGDKGTSEAKNEEPLSDKRAPETKLDRMEETSPGDKGTEVQGERPAGDKGAGEDEKMSELEVVDRDGSDDERMDSLEGSLNELYEKMRDPEVLVNDSAFSLIDKCLFFSERHSNNLRLCIPESMIPEVLKMCHDACGHPGIQRTYSSISLRFYFRKMSRQIRQYVDDCYGGVRTGYERAREDTEPR